MDQLYGNSASSGAQQNPVDIAMRELASMLKNFEEERNQLENRLSQVNSNIQRLNGAVNAMDMSLKSSSYDTVIPVGHTLGSKY